MDVFVVDRCNRERGALKAMQDKLHALEQRKAWEQKSLQRAGPGAKAAIAFEIKRLSLLAAQVEAQLPALRAALDRCQFPAFGVKGTGVQTGQAKRA